MGLFAAMLVHVLFQLSTPRIVIPSYKKLSAYQKHVSRGCKQEKSANLDEVEDHSNQSALVLTPETESDKTCNGYDRRLPSKIQSALSTLKDNIIAEQLLIQLFQLWETFIQGLFKEAIEGVFYNVSSHTNKLGSCPHLQKLVQNALLHHSSLSVMDRTDMKPY